MSRFPKLTETFVLYELVTLERLGFNISLYPLIRERESVRHAEVEKWLNRARFLPFFSLRILALNLRWILRAPTRYFSTLLTLLYETLGSVNFFFGSVAIFPKAVALADEMSADGIEHLHAHFANHPTTAAFIIHRLTGIPFSFTAHGSDLHKDQRMLERKVRAAAFVVTVSTYNRSLILRVCGEDLEPKVQVIHCGVDTNLLVPAEVGADGQALRIVSVGSLGEVKGHLYLIRACGLLADRGIPFECRIVGEGECRSKLEKEIRQLGLEKQVQLLGAQPRNEVLATISWANVMSLNSVPTAAGKREGIPVALMEGMAMGLPVVSSRLSGIPELVQPGEAGFLTEPRDVVGIADALQTLAREPLLRKQMGREARKKIVEEFDLEKNIRELAAQFEKQWLKN